MPPISKRFASPKPRRELPVSENPEATRSREYARAQFGLEAERRRIATKYRTRKSRSISKLVKEAHFKSLDATEQEEAVQRIKADCSEAAAQELAQAEEAWKRMTEVDSEEDDSGASDRHDDSGERKGRFDGEPMEEIDLGGGGGAEEEDETPIQQLAGTFNDIRRKYEKRWDAGLRYYTQVGHLEGDESSEDDKDDEDDEDDEGDADDEDDEDEDDED